MNMRRATLASLLLGFFAALPAVAQSTGGTRIGVVNMGKVFNSMQEVVEIKAKLENDAKAFQTEAQAHKAELANLQQQRDNGPKPDTAQWDEATQNLEKLSVKYEEELKLAQLDLARGQSRQLKLIFDKIEAAAGDIAKDKGLDIVVTEIRPEFPKNAQDMTPENVQAMINQRNMLYVSPQVDITDAVTAALDAKFKAGGK
jgi:Skp family chaperone for outer membrane proteins